MSHKRAYKWLNSKNQGSYGHGDYAGFLPTTDSPGAWTPSTTPRACASGWHVTVLEHLWSHWSVGGTLYRVECKGAYAVSSDKVAWETIRLVNPVGVLTKSVTQQFAIECAERVLPIFEAAHPGDDRPRKAIEAARVVLDGTGTAANAAYAAANATNAYAYATNAYAYAAAATAANAANAAYATYDAANAAYAAYAATNAAYAAYDAAKMRRWAGRRLIQLIQENGGN